MTKGRFYKLSRCSANMAYDVGCSLEEVKYTEHTYLTVFILFCQNSPSFWQVGRTWLRISRQV